MSHTRVTLGIAVAAWVVAIGGVVANSACSVNSTAISEVALPDRGQFIEGVSPFMEQRCGALDCHGQIGRPLRLYSSSGLRKADGEGGARDTRATTMDERLANYFSVVGLEPEDITTSRVTEGAYTDFLLLKKPLGIDQGGVRHKGGSVLRSTDPGFDCIALWIAGKYNLQKCKDGMIQPGQ